MQSSVLGKLFGSEKSWSGPCTLVLDADASIQTTGTDAIVNAGIKMFAPRLISGRISADAVCFVPDDEALVLVQQTRIRQSGGEDQFHQTVSVVNVDHVAAVEFTDSKVFHALGLSEPPVHVASSGKTRI